MFCQIRPLIINFNEETVISDMKEDAFKENHLLSQKHQVFGRAVDVLVTYLLLDVCHIE